MNRFFLLSLAVLAPVLVSGITEAEVAAAGRAYFAPMSSASFWRMRMPDGLIREFELRESGGRYTFKSVDGWTGSVQEGNAVLITTPKNVKPKVEWGFVNGTLHMIAEDGNAFGLDYAEPIVYENEKLVSLWPDKKEIKKKDMGGNNWQRDRRMKLWYSSPNRAGAVCAFVALIALGLVLRLRRLPFRLMAGVIGLAALVPMTLTGSRGALLAFAAGAIVIVACELKRLHLSRRTLLLVVGSVALAVLVVGGFFCFGGLRSKRGTRSSNRQRTMLMQVAPRMLRDAPSGWGYFAQVGAAYVNWYQGEKDQKLRLNLISDHVTNVVGRGWIGGGVYLLVWIGGIVTLLLFAWKGGSPIPAAVWLALAVTALFNLIFGEPSVFALPVLSLAFMIPGRPWRMPWIFAIGPAAGLVLSAAIIGGMLGLADDGSDEALRIRNEGRKRILVREERPLRWVVDDLQVIGQAMTGKEIRRHYATHKDAPGIGYVRSIRNLPKDGSVIHLVLAGKAGSDYLKMLKEKGYPEKMPQSVLFLAPQFPPSEIPEELHRRTRQVTMVVGEFAARYSREFLEKRPWVRIVPGAEQYIPNWMRFVAVK